MGGKGGGTNTVTNNSAPPAEVMAQYQRILGLANTQGDQPLQQYGGPMVAGFTPSQNTAFNTIDNAQGISAPYLNNAQNMIQDSQRPLWDSVQQWNPETMNQYMNPYTNDVVNATMANINETNAQQQQQVVGDAISKGAWGGDRAGIAQAELARQQALAGNQTIAGLRNQGYNTGMAAFQQQQGAQLGANTTNNWLASQGAFGEANLGTQALSNTLQGAGAQLASGQQQQTQAQSEMNIPYEQFLQQQAFPYQNLSWLSGISTGLGSGMGGTSSSTQPAPNQASQTLGTLGSLGMLGYLAFSDRRLKDHIKRIGKYKDYPMYEFRYKGDNVKNVGVMAQDVEKSNPAAVRESGGYKMVDYSKLARGGVARGITPRYSNGGFTSIPDAPHLNPESESSGPDIGMLLQMAKMAAMHRGGRAGYAPGGIVPDVSISYIPNANQASSMAHSTIPNAPQMPQQKQGGDSSQAVNLMSMLAKGSPQESLASSAGTGFTMANADANGLGDMVKGFQNPNGGTNMGSPVDFNGDSVPFGSPDISMWGKLLSHLGYSRGGDVPRLAPGGASPYDDLAYLYADEGDQPGDNIPPAPMSVPMQPVGLGPPPAPAFADPNQANGIAPSQYGRLPDVSGIENTEPTYNKPDPTMAILSGFAGMAAGQSPQFGNNFGAGVQAGLKTWGDQKEAAAKESYQKGSIKEQAEKLFDDANHWRESLTEEKSFHGQEIDAKNRELDLKARQKWTIDPNTGMPMNVYTGEMKNPYGGDGAAPPPIDENGKPTSNIPDEYFGILKPSEIMNYRNTVKKNQPKDLAAQQTILSSLIDQNTKISDLANQIPVASHGDYHKFTDFVDRNEIPILSDPKRAAATVSAAYDSLGNVLDNIKTTFGGTGRVLQAEFNTLKTELNASANGSVEQKAAVVGRIQKRLKEITGEQLQYTDDVASGMAYMPSRVYKSPMQKHLQSLVDKESGDSGKDGGTGTKEVSLTGADGKPVNDSAPSVLTAPPPAASRVEGKVYNTPKGPMTWTKAGWVPAGGQ